MVSAERLPRTLYRDGLFWACLVLWSFMPATLTFWVYFHSIPVNCKDLMLIFLIGLEGFRRLGRDRYRNRSNWHQNLHWYFLFLFFFAGFGLYHSTIPGRDALAMGFTLVMTLASFALAFLIIVRKDPAAVEEFVNLLVVSLTVVGFVYLAESMLGLGLRSDEGVETAHFGIQRLHGPLFGAAYGQFMLIPCLGFNIGKLRSGPRRRLSIPRLILVFINLISLLSLGSRGAVLCLAVYFLLYAFTSKGMGKKIARLLGMAVLFGAAALFVFSFADSSRLTNMEDHARSTTYEISMKIIESNGVDAILGPGYGSIWAWYLPDVEDGGARATNRFYIWTEYGSLLYNPHSILLMLVTELGVVGLAFFLKLLQTQVVLVRRAFHDEVYRSFICSMCSTFVVLLTDFPLFKNWPMSALWWLLFFGCSSLTMPEVTRRAFRTKQVQTLRDFHASRRHDRGPVRADARRESLGASDI